ncbi:MAG: hypothetical protein M1821_007814 [Bathelium mastoideum]|nr:MAG: hypothetical protein M1821_007814 [Bathelium mastoideum]KAI9688588.1 MAG: hypothetical protein M1822_001537 [Bathelium mastoideum]
MLLAASGGTVAAGAGVMSISEDAKHYYTAAERTGRVITALAVCINDYRVTLGIREKEGDENDMLLKTCHKRCAERTLSVLEKNGSIFIKLGQHLSSLGYLLPEEWTTTFVPLQDQCPVSSYDSIVEMVQKDTGKPLTEYFVEFEHEPIGAASLAQVHKAKMRDTGQMVAVKVQHPSLDEWAPLDLSLTRLTFQMLKRFFPEYDLTWLSDEMEASLPVELDFLREGENAIRTKEYFSHVRSTPLVIPDIIWAKRRILVMEYVTGHRPDDLHFLDSHGIDRDEVSAALARIFNEMIFGTNAPLHCDPHGGNIAIRLNNSRRAPRNFDVILYDHGLYRDIPNELRRSYAKLWLAVIEADEARMRKHAHEVAGITDDQFPLFASAITGRDYRVVTSGVEAARSEQEKEAITNALGDGMLEELVQLLGQVPRIILLILKTNDLTRSLDEGLRTRQGPVRSFLILARYASRAIYEEQLESLQGSLVRPRNILAFLGAWGAYMRVRLRLRAYELYLTTKRILGMDASLVHGGPFSIVS